MLEFTKRPKTPGMTSKSITFPEGNKLFAGDSHANLDKTKADMVQFGTEMELEMDCLTSRIILQKVCS